MTSPTTNTCPITSGPLAGLAWWAPGMLALPTFADSGSVLVSCVDSRNIGGIVDNDPHPMTFGLGISAHGMNPDEWEPCLEHAATRGVLLEQLREACGDECLYVQGMKPHQPSMDGSHNIATWYVRDHNGRRLAKGDTEAEALIAAFKAAGDRG